MLRLNGLKECCSNRRIGASGILSSFFSWFLPAALLFAIPKCPLCIVAYIAAVTGIGISVSTAGGIRFTLILGSVALLAFVLVRSLLRARRTATLLRFVGGIN